MAGRGRITGRSARSIIERVAVVAEPGLIGDALQVALAQRGFRLVRESLPSSTAEVVELRAHLHAFRPSVVVLLQEHHDPAQHAAAMRTISGLPGQQSLLLSGSPPGPDWGGGLVAGAAAVVPVSTRLDAAARILARLCRGEEVMIPAERERLIAAWGQTSTTRRAVRARLGTLTPKELEVLQQLRGGRSVAEIAEDSGVTVDTVRSHVKAILRKLEVSSQLAAVALLQQATDVTPP